MGVETTSTKDVQKRGSDISCKNLQFWTQMRWREGTSIRVGRVPDPVYPGVSYKRLICVLTRSFLLVMKGSKQDSQKRVPENPSSSLTPR